MNNTSSFDTEQIESTTITVWFSPQSNDRNWIKQ